MSKLPVLVVFGLSGVGKSLACQKFSKNNPIYLYLEASELLRTATDHTSEELRTSSSRQILGNQMLLGDAFRGRRKGQEHRPVLLAAHSVIDTGRGVITVPIEVISSLSPTGLIFLKEDTEIVQHRRANGSRQRPLLSIDELRRQQNLAEATVLTYGEQLDVPVFVGSSRYEIFEQLIETAINGWSEPQNIV